MPRRGIVIVNTGTPASPTPVAVRAYLREFLTDPRICPMNPHVWSFILNTFILPRRSKASAAKYAQVWTDDGSPLNLHMESLARKLQDAFAASGGTAALVRHAMSYGEPSVLCVLRELMQADCDELVIVPLYPQSAHSTTRSAIDKATSALQSLSWSPAFRVVEGYAQHDGYLEAIAQSIRDAGFDARTDRLLMTFHSIPMRDIRNGDTYGEQVRSSCAGIASRLGVPDEAWRIAFQCRFDKSRSWLGPSTREVMAEFHPGTGRLVVVAPNFSIDCLETLYDIEVELRRLYLGCNPGAAADSLVYVPCLNDSDAHIALLREIVS